MELMSRKRAINRILSMYRNHIIICSIVMHRADVTHIITIIVSYYLMDNLQIIISRLQLIKCELNFTTRQ